MRVVEDLRDNLFGMMQSDPTLTVIGEDILDPYGGAFKVTKGLSDAFADRVITMPISESGIVGLGLGMALRGRRVVAEIMFGDFLTLTFDQIMNHAAKVQWMFNDAVRAPLVIRTPMGGGRGYGPTHSQSIEKHFCGIPGLTVLAVNQYASPGALLNRAVSMGTPVLFIENKISYSKLVEPDRIKVPDDPDAVLVTYGGMTEMCVRAAEQLEADEELSIRVIPVQQLSPFPSQSLVEQIGTVNRVFCVEEGTEEWGFGAAVAEALLREGLRPEHFETISAASIPIPSARDWELSVLPNVDRVTAAVLDSF